MATDSAKAVVASLRAEGKNAPKPLCFNLRNQLKDEDFARAFVEEGGMDALMGVAVQATGNVQTYALIALRVAISHRSGAEGTLQKGELLEQLVELLESPLVPVVKQVAEILGVLSCSGPSSWRRIHQAAKKSAKGREKKPYASLVQCIVAQDLDLQVNALVLMNNLLSAAPERMRKFLNVWRELGAEDKLKTVAQTTKYEALIAQVQQYQRKLLTAFPEAARIIDDPSSSSQQQTSPTPAPATAMSRTRRGTITIAKKVAAVGTLRKRDKDKDKESKESPKSAKREVDDHGSGGGEPTLGNGEESAKEKEKEKEPVSDEQHSNDEPNSEKEEKQQKAKKKKKKQHKAAKKEGEPADDAERDVHQRNTVDEEEEEKRCVNATPATDVSAAEPSSLASSQSSSSLDEVKAMRDKMESLAGQVEKLKEVGKALVQKKESEIQALKKELGELSEENNRHKKELDGFRRELQRKEEMAVHAEERNKRESVVLESKRSRKDSRSTKIADPVQQEAPPSPLSSSPSLTSVKELEVLRAEVEGLKKELGEARTENETLKKAEKQRAANAALLVKEMKAEEKHYASTAEMLDDFQKMKEQVMKLQLLKEQVIKEMRQIKKTAFVGFPEFGEKLGGIDGLEMKQIQEELERERKEKEAAQAEVLLLKTKISEIGSPEEVEELRKRTAELVQTNQKVTKENTALRVSMLEARMKSKQDASSTKQAAPAKSKEDVERLETELAHKDREVMKVLKTKYDTELETRKQVESELATLREQHVRERMEQQPQTAGDEEKAKKKKKKKGKESDAEEEEDAIFKRKARDLEEEKAKWAKERAEMEMRLHESQKNEYTSTNAAFSLNEQVEKLEAELDVLRAERQETTLQDKVARLEKEKKDLQEHFGKELNELRGQTASLYEADIEKLKEEVTRLQREKQMACQLLVSSNDKLKKMESLLDNLKKDASRS